MAAPAARLAGGVFQDPGFHDVHEIDVSDPRALNAGLAANLREGAREASKIVGDQLIAGQQLGAVVLRQQLRTSVTSRRLLLPCAPMS